MKVHPRLSLTLLTLEDKNDLYILGSFAIFKNVNKLVELSSFVSNVIDLWIYSIFDNILVNLCSFLVILLMS